MQSASKTKAQTGLPQGASLAGPTCVTCERNRCRKEAAWWMQSLMFGIRACEENSKDANAKSPKFIRLEAKTDL